MHPLAKVGVLVTRPAQQAEGLCRMLESEGAAVMRWPAIRIEPLHDAAWHAATRSSIDAYSGIIFTSANAVEHGIAPLGEPRSLPIIAIGPATGMALHHAGFAALTLPEGADSESLLDHPLLRTPAARRFLIVKGALGRNVLQTELTARDAAVDVAQVYRRVRIERSPEEMATLASSVAARSLQFATATSVEVVSSLFEPATWQLRQALDRLIWVVPSERVAAALRSFAGSAPIIRAMSASDQDLVDAIRRRPSKASLE